MRTSPRGTLTWNGHRIDVGARDSSSANALLSNMVYGQSLGRVPRSIECFDGLRLRVVEKAEGMVTDGRSSAIFVPATREHRAT